MRENHTREHYAREQSERVLCECVYGESIRRDCTISVYSVKTSAVCECVCSVLTLRAGVVAVCVLCSVPLGQVCARACWPAAGRLVLRAAAGGTERLFGDLDEPQSAATSHED